MSDLVKGLIAILFLIIASERFSYAKHDVEEIDKNYFRIEDIPYEGKKSKVSAIRQDIANEKCISKGKVEAIPDPKDKDNLKKNKKGQSMFKVSFPHDKKKDVSKIDFSIIKKKIIINKKVKDVLSKYFCLGMRDRATFFALTKFNNKSILTEELYNKGIELPKRNSITIQLPLIGLKTPLLEEMKKDAVEEKPKKKKVEKFKEDLRDDLLRASKDKLATFDTIIAEIKGSFNSAEGKFIQLESDYKTAKNSVENTIADTFNRNVGDIKSKLQDLRALDKEFNDTQIKSIKTILKKQEEKISGLEKTKAYQKIENLKVKFENASKNKDLERKKGRYYSVENIENMGSVNIDAISDNIKRAVKSIEIFDREVKKIANLSKVIDDLDTGASEKGLLDLIIKFAIYIAIFVFVVAVVVFIYLQNRKIKKLSKMSQSAQMKFTDMEDKIRSTSEKIQSSKQTRRAESPDLYTQPVETPKSPQEIKIEKLNDLTRDYQETLNNPPKIAGFKQKWNGLALSRKERQEGSKTVLVSSGRAFEKSEIWCVSFDDKIFAFPGSSVKSNMAIYMNLDFAKAQMDFKGVFNISEGSNYSVEPCGLRKGGAGYVVERPGKIQFPR
jgi:hypothetical protein